MKKLTISFKELGELLGATTPAFPKYVTQILNLANQNSQGTRPRVVGQLSELIQEFQGAHISEWADWYLERYPNAIEDATQKIINMVENLKLAIARIDENMIREWVKDLVIVKSFVGLLFQEAVLRKLSRIEGKPYRLATPEEESKGIDGFIDGRPVSIKPHTYDSKKALPEEIQGIVVKYKKTKSGLTLTF